MQVRALPTTLTLLFASAAAPAQVTLYQPGAEASTGDRFGFACTALGDVDGDLVPDFAVGAPRDSSNGAFSGSVWIYSGQSGDLVRQIAGAQPNEQFGWALDRLGDVDGDGADDLVVGAPFHGTGALGQVGRAAVISGATGATLSEVVGWQAGQRMGSAVAGLGDYLGDGDLDYAVAAPHTDETAPYVPAVGLVQIRDAVDQTTHAQLWGEASSDLFGERLAALGALPGFPRGGLAIGAPEYGSEGRGYVFGGTTLLFSVTGGLFERLGHAVACVGDVDGDGWDEVAFGAPLADAASVNDGRVHVWSAALGVELEVLTGTVAGGQYGLALAGLGDVDGDGRGDYAVGAPLDTFGTGIGLGGAYIVSGATGATIATVPAGFTDAGELVLAAAGDLNADGVQELLLGGPHSYGTGPDAGEARLVFATAPPVTTYCTAKSTSLGCTPRIASIGAPSASVGDNFHVLSDRQSNQTVGMLVLSWGADAIPAWGGTLCLSLPIKRTPLQWSGGSPTGSDCTGAYDFHVSHAYLAAWGHLPGQTLHGQYWSHDPGFVARSDALAFTILP